MSHINWMERFAIKAVVVLFGVGLIGFFTITIIKESRLAKQSIVQCTQKLSRQDLEQTNEKLLDMLRRLEQMNADLKEVSECIEPLKEIEKTLESLRQ